MEIFLQATAGVLITVILGITLSKQSKDLSLVLTLLACSLILTVVIAYLNPVMEFIGQVRLLGNLNGESFRILLKAVGIGIISEIAIQICQDSGNAALGKGLQLLATVVVLWLSLPLMQELLELVQKILGDV